MEQLRQLRVRAKLRETPDATTFVLEPADSQPLAYKPGQYLPLVLHSQGHEMRRAYSFSSCPDVDAYPSITLRRIPNGVFSNWLWRDVEPGNVLTCGQPAGRFLLPDPLPKYLVYVVAGSGMTPVFSHLKALLESPGGKTPPFIHLLYANRDRNHTLFLDRIERWQAEKAAHFSADLIFSREAGTMGAHLNQSLLETLLRKRFPNFSALRKSARVYLCAPGALMRMAEMTLRVLDFPPGHLHRETFVPDARLPVRTPNPDIRHTVTVRGAGGQTTFEVFDGETILNGALRQGIPLPYTCKSGVCLTCLARCVQGEVDMLFVDATRRSAPGEMINTCIGYAMSDFVELALD